MAHHGARPPGTARLSQVVATETEVAHEDVLAVMTALLQLSIGWLSNDEKRWETKRATETRPVHKMFMLARLTQNRYLIRLLENVKANL